MRYPRSHPRSAFTLIEMLVAMALTMFIMVIISQAFTAGLSTFRGLKGIGDMQAGLRTAVNSLRSDLMQDHFEGHRKLSDRNLMSAPSNSFVGYRPREGFLMIRQNTPSVFEGNDADNLPSFRAVDHVLGCSIRLRGNRREHYMMSRDIPTFPPVPPAPPPQKWSPLSKRGTNFWDQDRDGLFNPGGPGPGVTTSIQYQDPVTLQMLPDTYASQWAEVHYFLLRTGTSDEPANAFSQTGAPLFGLYRSQHLLVPNNQEANSPTGADVAGTTNSNFLIQPPYRYAGISCYPTGVAAPGPLYFNAPADVANQSTPTTAYFINGVAVKTVGMENRVMSALGNINVALPLPPPNNPVPASYPPGTRADAPPRSTTLVVPNVTSFQIQVLYDDPTNPNFRDLQRLPIPGQNPPNILLHDTSLATPTIFNANSSFTPTIIGIKITIRVLDPNTKLSRQLSVVQDM